MKNDRGLNGGVRDTWGRAADDVMRHPFGVSSAADAGADADNPTYAAASAPEFRASVSASRVCVVALPLVACRQSNGSLLTRKILQNRP